MLAVSNDARLMSVDMRLVDPTAEDRADSKVNQLVANVLRINRERPDATQLVFSDLGVHPKVGRGIISIYDDITEKLVEGGMPRDKIINFARLTDSQRDRAIQRIWDGDARVALGGTQKMGTGVNAQQHLFAAHHLDVAWLPAWMMQRDGRIVRQENKHIGLGVPVEIYRYVTVGGFDELMWQTNDRKCGFINTIMEGGSAVERVARHFEEVDGEEFSYAQVAAIASGNPDVLRSYELGRELEELGGAERRHRQSQLRLRDDIADVERRITSYQLEIDSAAADILTRDAYAAENAARQTGARERNQPLREGAAEQLREIRAANRAGEIGDDEAARRVGAAERARDERLEYEGAFMAKVGDRAYKARSLAGDAILARFNAAFPEETLGEYRGFRLVTKAADGVRSRNLEVHVVGSGVNYELNFWSGEGLFKSADSKLDNIEKDLAYARKQVESLTNNRARLEEEVGKPFRYAERLAQVREEHEEVQGRLIRFGKSDEELAKLDEQEKAARARAGGDGEAHELDEAALAERARLMTPDERETRAAQIEERLHAIVTRKGELQTSDATRTDRREEEREYADLLRETERLTVEQRALRVAEAEGRDAEAGSPEAGAGEVGLRRVMGAGEFMERARLIAGLPAGLYAGHAEATRDESGRRLRLNVEAYELLRSAMEAAEVEGSGEGFSGRFLRPSETAAVLHSLEEAASDMAVTDATAAGRVRAVADEVERAFVAADGAVVFYTEDGAVLHEDFHRASYLAAAGRDLEARHARLAELYEAEEMGRARPLLVAEGYPDERAVLVEELAAAIENGECERYGLNTDQAAGWLECWFASVAEANGELSKERFRELTDESRQIRDRAYEQIFAPARLETPAGAQLEGRRVDARGGAEGEGRDQGAARKDGGAEERELGERELAPVFYSRLERVLTERLPAWASVPHVKDVLLDERLGLMEEARAAGLPAWIDEREERAVEAVKRSDITDYLRAHARGVRAVVLAETATEQSARLGLRRTFEEHGGFELRENAQGRAHLFRGDQRIDPETDALPPPVAEAYRRATDGTVRFRGSVYANSENYREVLIVARDGYDEWRGELAAMSRALEAGRAVDFSRLDRVSAVLREAESSGMSSNFRSEDYPDVPNVVARLCWSEGVDADGRRTLVIHDLHSDAAVEQERRSRYGDDVRREWLLGQRDTIHKGGLNDEAARDEAAAIDAELSLLSKGAAPAHAAYTRRWHEVAMRYALRYAAENGIEQVAWPGGEEIERRNQLSRYAERLEYDETSASLRLAGAEGVTVQQAAASNRRELEEVAGRQLAARLMAKEAGGDGRRTLEGAEMDGADAGAVLLYEERIAEGLARYTRAWGAQVGDTTIRVRDGFNAHEYAKSLSRGRGEEYEEGLRSGREARFRAVQITEVMRAEILYNGQPLLKREEEDINERAGEVVEHGARRRAEIERRWSRALGHAEEIADSNRPAPAHTPERGPAVTGPRTTPAQETREHETAEAHRPPAGAKVGALRARLIRADDELRDRVPEQLAAPTDTHHAPAVDAAVKAGRVGGAPDGTRAVSPEPAGDAAPLKSGTSRLLRALLDEDAGVVSANRRLGKEEHVFVGFNPADAQATREERLTTRWQSVVALVNSEHVARGYQPLSPEEQVAVAELTELASRQPAVRQQHEAIESICRDRGVERPANVASRVDASLWLAENHGTWRSKFVNGLRTAAEQQMSLDPSERAKTDVAVREVEAGHRLMLDVTDAQARRTGHAQMIALRPQEICDAEGLIAGTNTRRAQGAVIKCARLSDGERERAMQERGFRAEVRRNGDRLELAVFDKAQERIHTLQPGTAGAVFERNKESLLRVAESVHAREIIGDELGATLEAKHADHLIKQHKALKPVLRYEVTEGDVTRRLSERDVEARAMRQVRAAVAGWRPEEGEQTRQSRGQREEMIAAFYKDHLSYSRGTLDQIERQHAARGAMLEESAENKHAALAQAKTRAAGARFNALGSDDELKPFVSFPRLDRLQEQALSRGDVQDFTTLDAIRFEQAQEFGVPARDVQQTARLKAQLRVAELETKASERRADRFDENLHTRQVRVSGARRSHFTNGADGDLRGSPRDEMWSLVDVAAVEREANHNISRHDKSLEHYQQQGAGNFGKFFLKRALHSKIGGHFLPITNPVRAVVGRLNPIVRIQQDPVVKAITYARDFYQMTRQVKEVRAARAAEAEKLDLLSGVRAEVNRGLREEMIVPARQVAESRSLLDALRGADARNNLTEAAYESVRPVFTGREVKRVSELATETSDPAALRVAAELERVAQAKGLIEGEDLAGRAVAREMVAGVRHAEAQFEVARLSRVLNEELKLTGRDVMPVPVEAGGEYRAMTLRDCEANPELRGPVEQAVGRMAAGKEARAAEAAEFHGAAAREADDALARAGVNAPDPLPQFTPKEHLEVEAFGQKVSDTPEMAEVRGEVADVARRALREGRVLNDSTLTGGDALVREGEELATAETPAAIRLGAMDDQAAANFSVRDALEDFRAQQMQFDEASARMFQANLNPQAFNATALMSPPPDFGTADDAAVRAGQLPQTLQPPARVTLQEFERTVDAELAAANRTIANSALADDVAPDLAAGLAAEEGATASEVVIDALAL